MGWRKKTTELFDHVQQVFTELADYRPLTLRQVFYQLVQALVIENNLHRYKSLSKILSEARTKGLIPWTWMEDRTRGILTYPCFTDKSLFLNNELEYFLIGYQRDLLQGQATRPEIWVEKDALAHIAYRVASTYTVPVAPARGFSSTSYLHEFRERVWTHAEQDQRTIILYFGDLDPSGWTMLPSMIRKLEAEFQLNGIIESERIALTPDQVSRYDLPTDPVAMKEKDPNRPKYQAWLREQGLDDTLSVELDALPPAVLEDLIRESIEENIDLSRFQQEQERHREELAPLNELREQVLHFVQEHGPE